MHHALIKLIGCIGGLLLMLGLKVMLPLSVQQGVFLAPLHNDLTINVETVHEMHLT